MHLFYKGCYDGWNYIQNVCNLSTEIKEHINYWLNGTATKANFFDKACSKSWDYINNMCCEACNIPVINNEDACEQLAVTCEAPLDYFSFLQVYAD